MPLPLPPGARKDAPSQTFKREDEQCKELAKERRERENAREEREREEGERRRQRMQNLKPLPLPPSSSSSNIQDDPCCNPPQEQCTAGPGESSGVLGKAYGMLHLDVRGCECAQEFEQGEFVERHRLMSPEGVVGVAIQQALEVRLNDLLGKRGSCTVSVTSTNEEQRYVIHSLSPWKGEKLDLEEDDGDQLLVDAVLSEDDCIAFFPTPSLHMTPSGPGASQEEEAQPCVHYSLHLLPETYSAADSHLMV